MMNAYRLAGDCCHVAAFIIILYKLLNMQSCAGISGKSQILFAIVYTTRYIDLFLWFVSVYNTSLKLAYIFVSYSLVFFVFHEFKSTYEKQHDTMRIDYLIIPCFVLSILFTHSANIVKMLWAFSIYLEAVAILPQMYLIYKSKKIEPYIFSYLFMLFCYRALYIANWAYIGHIIGQYDLIAIFGGVVQTLIYLCFFCYDLRQKQNNYVLNLPLSIASEHLVKTHPSQDMTDVYVIMGDLDGKFPILGTSYPLPAYEGQGDESTANDNNPASPTTGVEEDPNEITVEGVDETQPDDLNPIKSADENTPTSGIDESSNSSKDLTETERGNQICDTDKEEVHRLVSDCSNENMNLKREGECKIKDQSNDISEDSNAKSLNVNTTEEKESQNSSTSVQDEK